MYTSKHTSLSPNQFMRPQRDHSPSHKQQPKGSKFYSSQQVARMIKSYIQPKILYLRNELEQKQKIIQMLNQKLDDNDQKINKMYNYAQNIARRQKQPDQHGQVIPLINQVLNDKLKQYWQTVNGQIQKVKQTFMESNFVDSKKMQAKIQMELESIRKHTAQYVEASRIKNNNYWLKIKQALNRINSKLMKVDQTIQKTNQNIENFRHQSHQQHEYINELQKSKTVVKKLIQLKKSVKNIYENYQSVLQLQNQFKNRVTDLNHHQQRRSNEQSTDLIDFNDSRGNQNIQQSGNTFPMFRKKPINFTEGIKQFDTQNEFFQPSRKYQFHQNGSQNHFPQDNFALQYSKDQHGSQVFHAPMTSKSSANNTDKNTFSTKYYVPSVSSKKNNPIYFIGGQSPSKNSPQSVKWQNGLSSPNELSCLNSSSNALRQGGSRSTSFVNLSLQNRNQMSQSVKQRIQEIIELKNLTKPLLVYLDEINYLKNNEGNYLFDTRGNMFKVNMEEGRQLQRLGIIKFIDKNNPRDNSSGKKSNLVFGGTNTSENVLSRGKSVGISNSKIKSISIKQTAI